MESNDGKAGAFVAEWIEKVVNLNRVDEWLLEIMSVMIMHIPPSQQKGSRVRRILGQAAEGGKCLVPEGSYSIVVI